MRKITHNGKVILCLFATKKIVPGQEIRYDYGVKNLPWRPNGNSAIKSKQHQGTIMQEIQPKTLAEADTRMQPNKIQRVADNNCNTTHYAGI
ncbi:hypothetical protein HOLleu_03007 [Holothuria leucospilota]|uniref:SET domain-containing protein n=1 Tax=Holothuria leucospilota TaxID=206669 RepID=A0A9Q1CR35_HOLLE|nr:hypothetical protein HOLleu_03007 [Holothuria leucospilota]